MISVRFEWSRHSYKTKCDMVRLRHTKNEPCSSAALSGERTLTLRPGADVPPTTQFCRSKQSSGSLKAAVRVLPVHEIAGKISRPVA